MTASESTFALPLELRYEVGRDDLAIARRESERLCRTTVGYDLLVANFVGWACIGAGVMALVDGQTSMTRVGWGLALLVAGAMIPGLGSRRAARRAWDGANAELEPFPLAQTLRLQEDGLVVGNRFGTAHIAWAGVRGVRELPQHVAIVLRASNVSVVPHSAFADAAQREAFVQRIRRVTGT